MKKTIKRTLNLALCLLVCLLALTSCNIANGIPQFLDQTGGTSQDQKYEEACELIDEGKLEEAYAILKELNDYEPAKEKIKNFFYAPQQIVSDYYGTYTINYNDQGNTTQVYLVGDRTSALVNNYTYDEKNPYPATAYEDAERLKLPYGKIFNIPQFNEAEEMDITKVVLDKGKVVLKVDSQTGKIDDVDYFYRCSVTGVLVENVKDNKGNETVMTTTMKNVIENQEYFKMK